MKNNYLHIAGTLILVVLLFILSDIFMIWMPSMLSMTLLSLAAVLLSVWVGLVLREEANDEREAEHRMYAGRVASISGVVILLGALLTQGFAQAIDPWIAFALGGMVLSKSLVRMYLDTYK